MMESSKTTKEMAEANKHGQTEMRMMGSGDLTKRMETAPLFLVTDSHSKVFGLTMCYKESCDGLKVIRCD